MKLKFNKKVMIIVLCGFSLLGCLQSHSIESSPNVSGAHITPDKFTSESTQVPSQPVDFECINEVEADVFNSTSETSGVLAIVKNGFDAMLLDTRTKEKRTLGEVYSNLAISPDHRQLAYIDINANQIIISDATGDRHAIPIIGNWRRVLQWLKSNKLLIEDFRTLEGEKFIPSSTITLDLGNGEYQEYIPDYPGILSYSFNGLHWQEYSTTLAVYDSSLAYVIYPAVSGNETPIILWNLEEKKEVVRIHTEGYWGGAPRWNPEETIFVVSAPPQYIDVNGNVFSNGSEITSVDGSNELFLVNHNGVISRLTHVAIDQAAVQQNYSWSPDGTFIAFWLKVGNSNSEWELAIVDVSTGEITNLCIHNQDDALTNIVWSPDGRQLAVNVQNDKLSTDIILIDLDKKNATKFVTDAQAIGWLIIP